MADALTRAQLEILRRLREDIELSGAPFVPNLLSELAFLRTFRLVEVRGDHDVLLTDAGRRYLACAERAGAAVGPSEGWTTQW